VISMLVTAGVFLGGAAAFQATSPRDAAPAVNPTAGDSVARPDRARRENPPPAPTAAVAQYVTEPEAPSAAGTLGVRGGDDDRYEHRSDDDEHGHESDDHRGGEDD